MIQNFSKKRRGAEGLVPFGRATHRHWAVFLIVIIIVWILAFQMPGGSPSTFPKEVTRGPRPSHRIALTFDAGGGADGLPELLDELGKARVTCTFFLTGKWAVRHPGLAREIVRRGHEIGNHSWSHPDLTKLSDEKIRIELSKADEILTELYGRSVKPLFRAPFGARNARVLRIAGETGYRSIYWSLDTLDSVDPPKTAPFLIARATSPSDSQLGGSVILMHVGESATVDAVPLILSNYKRRGFQCVSVSKLLEGE